VSAFLSFMKVYMLHRSCLVYLQYSPVSISVMHSIVRNLQNVSNSIRFCKVHHYFELSVIQKSFCFEH
jgi:hypothetical protein